MRSVPVWPLALFVTALGCSGTNDQTDDEPKKRDAQVESVSNRHSFQISNTEFGIDLEASSVIVETLDSGATIISVEVTGDEETFDPLNVDDDSEWSWALSPPAFFLRKFPVTRDENGDDVAKVRWEDVDNYEFAIYMMEHNSIHDMSVRLTSTGQLSIDGKVDLFGEMHDFRISWIATVDDRGNP